jgi:hypothetical protein
VSVEWLNKASVGDKASVINAAVKEAAGPELKTDVIDRSLTNIVFTVDPLAGTYQKLLVDGVTNRHPQSGPTSTGSSTCARPQQRLERKDFSGRSR